MRIMKGYELVSKFRTFFRLLYITIFLVFGIDFLRGLEGYLYHASPVDVLRTTAFLLSVCFLFAAGISFVLTLVTGFLKNISLLYKIVHVLCLIAFGLGYIHAFSRMDQSHTLRIYFWDTGIIPIMTVGGIAFISVRWYHWIHRWTDNVIHALWKPCLIISVVSLVWTAGIMTSFFIRQHKLLGVTPDKALNMGVNKPNVIIITFDALTNLDMSLYGYHRNTTPELDKIADQFYVFDNMYTNFVLTTPALISMFTSKYPWVHKVQYTGDYLREGRDKALFALFPDYDKIAVVSVEFADIRLIGLGNKSVKTINKVSEAWFIGFIDYFLYATCHNTIPVNALPFLAQILPVTERDKLFIERCPDGKNQGFILDPKESFDLALDALKDVNAPFLLWIHLFPPNQAMTVHANDPPEPFRYTFTTPDTVIPEEMGPADYYGPEKQHYIDNYRALYDEKILYADYCAGEFFRELKDMGYYDNSLIIISSDHGECFQKGWKGHGIPCLYNTLTNIPLLIHLPGQVKGGDIHTPAETVDLMPTILDVVNKPVPDDVDGESLLPYMRDTALTTKKAKYSSWLISHRRRGLRRRIEKNIAVILDGYKLNYDVKKDHGELYRLEDKEELVNLYDEEQAIADKLKSYIPDDI